MCVFVCVCVCVCVCDVCVCVCVYSKFYYAAQRDVYNEEMIVLAVGVPVQRQE